MKKVIITSLISPLLLTIFTACQSPVDPDVKTSITPEIQPSLTPETPKLPTAPLTVAEGATDSAIDTIIKQYLADLSVRGYAPNNQGIWIQTNNKLLANHQGNKALSAASITKVATSLVTLNKWGPDHQFITLISTNGVIENGILKGDLIVQGDQDPFFVWEEAFALGNLLNKIGIQEVTGNLIITGKFYMNYENNPKLAGNLFKQAINSNLWPQEALTQYQGLSNNIPRPNVKINGEVTVLSTPPANSKILIKHYSFPLAELLKKMNQYSNNLMADMFAQSVGGAKIVAEEATKLTSVTAGEIQLVNGSGLGEENIISPRAATALFLALEKYLQSYNLNIADLLVVVGQDEGILDGRKSLPNNAVVKSGSLDNVSALAGALPTEKDGIIWFAILNQGPSLNEMRSDQEKLLNNLLKQFPLATVSPAQLTPSASRKNLISRSEIVK
jgi:D-alanyl-D-alanine carboxypeptidase/D-alanyl-D-alanine-endopeptidase (penicillin-binding protein 4)